METVVLSLASRSVIVLGFVAVLFAVAGVTILLVRKKQEADGSFDVDSAPTRSVDPQDFWGKPDSFGRLRVENAKPVHLSDNPELKLAAPNEWDTPPDATNG